MGPTARARWSFARSYAAASCLRSWPRCRPARWPWRRVGALTMALWQSFGVYGSLSLRAVSAPPNRRWRMILSAIAEKLKRRSKDDFKGRHFEATLILQAVSWYLHYPLSYRDIEELLLERGLEVDHSPLIRGVLAYAPLIECRLRHFRKPSCSPPSATWRWPSGSFARC